MSIVITGASGHLGRRTAEMVLDLVPPSEVVLTTRRPETLTDLAARGVEVRRPRLRPAEAVAVDDEAFVRGLTRSGMPEPAAQAVVSFGGAIREGYIGEASGAVEELTGRPPGSLREVFEAHDVQLLKEESA